MKLCSGAPIKLSLFKVSYSSTIYVYWLLIGTTVFRARGSSFHLSTVEKEKCILDVNGVAGDKGGMDVAD